MKKTMLILCAMLISIVTFADGPVCKVSGSSNGVVASITNPEVTSGKFGDVYVYVELTKEAAEDVSVVVKLYDGNTVVKTAVVRIPKGNTQPINGWWHIEKLPKANYTYTAKIAEAVCY